ncbi:hypothetical protein [Parabacteroides sp.]
MYCCFEPPIVGIPPSLEQACMDLKQGIQKPTIPDVACISSSALGKLPVISPWFSQFVIELSPYTLR